MKFFLRALALGLLALAVTACHSDDSIPSYPISGTVSGLTADGLVLQNYGGSDLPVLANASAFEFPMPVIAGGSYGVTIVTQPTGETCAVTQGAGTNVRAPVANVGVICAPDTYVISGRITGLTASGLTLQDNGGDDLDVLANSGSFQFATQIAAGGTYNVQVASQPDGLICTVGQGSGADVVALINNINVTCSVATSFIGGRISGLTTGNLVLENNGTDDLQIPANSTTFQFPMPVAVGGAYAVTVAQAATGLTCTVSNGTGTTGRSDVSLVQVTCNTATFQVDGTVTGLSGPGLKLTNNGGDERSVSPGNPNFVFATQVAYGSGYAVTVSQQPTGQTCSVIDGIGTATAAVNLQVNCINNPTYSVTPSAGANGSISPDTPQVVNSGANVSFTATPDTGYNIDQWLVDGMLAQSGGDVYSLTDVTANHIVSVTFATATLSVNTQTLALAASGLARQVVVTNTGSIAATNLQVAAAALPAGTAVVTNTCTATLDPLASCSITIAPGATASSSCGSGIAPTPGTVQISSDSSNSVSANILVLTYGCIYEGGYVYSLDDTSSTSLGGAVFALQDSSLAVHWASTFTTVGASSQTDGAANTALIVATLGNDNGTPYAALVCKAPSAGYSDWYLPAESELVQVSLHAPATAGFDPGLPYSSSTEASTNPTFYAWDDVLSDGTMVQLAKISAVPVRCARQIN